MASWEIPRFAFGLYQEVTCDHARRHIDFTYHLGASKRKVGSIPTWAETR
jgi:hypothetical protein